MHCSLSFVTILVLSVGVPCAAQIANSSSSQGSAEPSQVPSTAQTGTPSQTSDANQPVAAKKPKKVWTDENLSEANGPVSVVGDARNLAKTKTNASKPADSPYIASVRKQLEKYQEQMADADKQLADLKNFSEGEPSTSASGIKLNKGYNREPIEVQMRALQEQKKQIQGKIDALFDEARKKGIESGQLR
jgi:hypothetical protein